MSDTAAPAAKNRTRWRQRKYLTGAIFPLVPLVAAYSSFFKSPNSSQAVRLWAGCSWLAVGACTILTAYAIYRIRVNLEYNARPFTPKDRKYCRLAAAVALGAAVAVLTASLFATPGRHAHAIGLPDLISAQMLCCLVLSSVLFLLADVHARGAKLYEELEQGV